MITVAGVGLVVCTEQDIETTYLQCKLIMHMNMNLSLVLLKTSNIQCLETWLFAAWVYQ